MIQSIPPQSLRMLRWFEFEHLPPNQQEIGKAFAELAQALAQQLPGGPETTTCLRKLLEAKDCAVRASLIGDNDVPGGG